MTKPKNPEPNPIEEAIGDRTKTAKDVPKIVDNPKFQDLAQNPAQIPDEPSPSEMLTLEELNRRTEEKLQDSYPEENLTWEEKRILNQTEPITPVSKPDLQLPEETSSQESPPQKVEIQSKPGGTPVLTEKAEYIAPPAEDVELTALKKYILEDGFVLSTVAFHIVSLCAEPLTTPSTTTWAFAERAEIPAMVLALLNQPGYLEGIWPSLRIVMGSNKGNAAWTAGIATTIAFFDTIRVLPALEELKNGS